MFQILKDQSKMAAFLIIRWHNLTFTHVSDHICNCSSYLIACRSSINAHCFGNSEARNSITYLLFLYKQPFKRKSNMADGRHFKIALDYNTGSKRGITYLNTCNLPNCGSRNPFTYLLRLYDLPFKRLIQYGGRQPFWKKAQDYNRNLKGVPNA